MRHCLSVQQGPVLLSLLLMVEANGYCFPHFVLWNSTFAALFPSYASSVGCLRLFLAAEVISASAPLPHQVVEVPPTSSTSKKFLQSHNLLSSFTFEQKNLSTSRRWQEPQTFTATSLPLESCGQRRLTQKAHFPSSRPYGPLSILGSGSHFLPGFIYFISFSVI